MPILEAQIATERPSRYLVQLCEHATAMGSLGHTARIPLHGGPARGDVRIQAEWSDSLGTITFNPWGRCTMLADGKSLTVRIDASDEDGLRQIQQVITRNVGRFGRRDGLTVAWRRPDRPAGVNPDRPSGDPPVSRSGWAVARWIRTNAQMIILAVVVLGVVAAHLGLAGAVVADSRWTGLVANVVVAIVLLKVVLVVLVRVGLRRHRSGAVPDGRKADGPRRG